MLNHTIVANIVATLLFFALTPGLFVRIPKHGSLTSIATMHTMIFGVVFFLLQQVMENMLDTKEGLPQNGQSCAGGTMQNGRCVHAQAQNTGTTTTGALGAGATKPTKSKK